MPKGGRRNHSGRPPKPTELKVVQGTFREDRHGGEVSVASGVDSVFPKPPKHLNKRERDAWKQLEALVSWVAPSDVLAVNGVVSLWDLLLRNQEAQRASAEAGHPLAFRYHITEDGEKEQEKHIEVEAKENPLYSQQIKIWRELRAYIALTGLSPVDRARMTPVGGAEEKPSKLADLMRRARARS
jgi:phage terminase small subunit